MFDSTFICLYIVVHHLGKKKDEMATVLLSFHDEEAEKEKNKYVCVGLYRVLFLCTLLSVGSYKDHSSISL